MYIIISHKNFHTLFYTKICVHVDRNELYIKQFIF